MQEVNFTFHLTSDSRPGFNELDPMVLGGVERGRGGGRLGNRRLTALPGNLIYLAHARRKTHKPLVSLITSTRNPH